MKKGIEPDGSRKQRRLVTLWPLFTFQPCSREDLEDLFATHWKIKRKKKLFEEIEAKGKSMLEKQGSAELKSGRRWATDLVLSFLDTNAKREIESSSLRH